MTDGAGRASLASWTFVPSAGLNVNGDIRAVDLFTNFLLNIVGYVVSFSDRKVFTDSQVKIDKLL